jgi:hypothetical protein
MQIKLWKYFIDEEKTEAWLNGLAAEGLNCVGTDFLMHRYLFERGAPGEYAYRITIMDHGIAHKDTIRYLAFLHENNIEYVAHGYRHFILRKKIADSPFALYTDRASQIKTNRTLFNFSLLMVVLLLPIIALNIGVAIWQINTAHAGLTVFNTLTALICLGLVALLCGQCRRYAARIRKLKAEGAIHE